MHENKIEKSFQALLLKFIYLLLFLSFLMQADQLTEEQIAGE